MKIWDARMMDSTVGEIGASQYSYGQGGVLGQSVNDVAWSIRRPGVLSIAVGDSVREYDTRSPGSKAIPVGVSYFDHGMKEDKGEEEGNAESLFVQCLAMQPQLYNGDSATASTATTPHSSFNNTVGSTADKVTTTTTSPLEYFPCKTLAVSSQGQVKVLESQHAAPLDISKRDGRVATGLGGVVWIGPTTDGKILLKNDI